MAKPSMVKTSIALSEDLWRRAKMRALEDRCDLQDVIAAVAGGLAMVGHWRPLFLRFQKGGKTVATAGGTFFGLATVLGLIGLGIWIAIFLVTRYASLASIVTSVSLPFVGLALGEPWPVLVFASAAAVAVLLLHKANIARLRAGTESRFRLRRA
jgi:glycerol-3-phosphate acyltransferase PlsY